MDELFHAVNDPQWVVHVFEPNPAITLDFSWATNVVYHKEAVWIEDTTLGFWQGRRELADEGLGGVGIPGEWSMVGSRLDAGGIQNIDNRGNQLPQRVDVKAIDFGAFLGGLPAGRIVVKMDIEGAEFMVLRGLLVTETIRRVSDLYIETHERFVEHETEESTKTLLLACERFGVKVVRRE
jgi:FkbM family methyltransferase